METILKTKLFIPPPPRDPVPRPRLLQICAGINRVDLMLIAAPAGFGKTTLLSTWIAQTETPVAWLSLNESDSDPTRFWSYVIAALQTLQPSVGEEPLAALRSPQHPPLETFMTMLINDLIAAFDDHIALVLDDYHLIACDEINDALTFLLDHLPPQIHIIITSRSEPALALSRLRVRRAMIDIRAEDLRFTADEIAVFFNQYLGLQLTAAHLAALEKRTEGWIAGMQLLALSLEGRGDTAAMIDALSAENRYIFDYLAEEVLDRQAPEVREFLLQTSVLDRMTGALADALTGRSDGQAMLETLSRANLLIIPLDEERNWYRYHHLFTDFLRAQLRRTHPELHDELHRRAATWYIEHEYFDDGIMHSFAAQDDELAADLIERTVELIFWQWSEGARLMRWLDALPNALVHTRPALCMSYAWVLLFSGRVDEAEPFLDSAESLVNEIHTDDDQRILLAGQIDVVRAEAAFYAGDTDRALALGDAALNKLPAEGNDFIKSMVYQLQGYVYRTLGNVQKAAPLLAEAHRLSRTRPQLIVHDFALSDLGETRVLEGKLHEAAALFRQLTERTNRPQTPTQSGAYIGLANVLREMNHLNEAEAYAVKGIQLAEQGGIGGVVRHGCVVLAGIHKAQGDFESAHAALAHAEAMADSLAVAHIVVQLATHRIALEIARGNLGMIDMWVRERDLRLDEDFDYRRELELVTLARARIAQGSSHEVVALLERLRLAAQHDGRMGNVIEDCILLAIAKHTLGETDEAVAILKHALDLAEPQGYVRLFVDAGKALVPLLGFIAAQGLHLNYINTLLIALDAQQASPIQGDVPVEDLTEREYEVLRLLALEMTNPEIAEQLYIGAGTVKTHTLNIYRKLNVRSRSEAVRRARELQLI